MWRSIAARARQHPHAQVLFKPPKPSLCPTKFPHQNHRILSYSSISDSSSCSKDLKIENGGDFDGTQVNSDTQMGSIGSVDEQLERVSNVNVSRINTSKWYAFVNVLRKGVPSESLEHTFDSMDLCLDEEDLVKMLRREYFPYKYLTRFLKWVLSKKEFRVSTSSLDMLGYLVTRSPDYLDAYGVWEFMKEIVEKKENGLLLNAKILNEFLLGFSAMDNEKGAFEVYGKFEEFGCTPNRDTYYHTIKTLCRQLAYDSAMPVCRKMLDTGLLPEESEQVVEIIGLLCKGNRAKEALAVYLAAKNIDKYSRLSLVNSVSKVVCCLSNVDELVHLAQEMLLGDISVEYRKYLPKPFLCVIRGLCRKNDIESAKKLLFEMIEKGPPPGNEVFDSVIVCLSKHGDLEDAWEILKLAERRGLTPKISSYSAVMSGYAKAGLMEEACKVLLAAKNKHTKLCPIDLCALIQGYCTRGELDKALRLFSELKNYGVVLNLDGYDMLIHSFSLCLKDFHLERAQKLLEEMREKGLYLPQITEGLERAV